MRHLDPYGKSEKEKSDASTLAFKVHRPFGERIKTVASTPWLGCSAFTRLCRAMISASVWGSPQVRNRNLEALYG